MRIHSKMLQVGIFVLQIFIAGYFLFNSTFINISFLPELYSSSSEIINNSENIRSILVENSKEKTSSNKEQNEEAESTKVKIYLQLITMANVFLLFSFKQNFFNKFRTFLKQFFNTDSSPPTIYQFYLFRGPPLC